MSSSLAHYQPIIHTAGKTIVANFDQIVKEYTMLREGGIGRDEAWRRLRPKVELFPHNTQQRLIETVRAYESRAEPKRRIKRLKRLPQQDPAPKTREPVKPSVQVEQTYCWKCGKPNRAGELICVHCGSVLAQNQQTAATRQLNMEDQQPEHFDEHGLLLLHVRHSNDLIKLRPQEYTHEVIVGRADANNVVTPDVDLTPVGAAQMGVSRLHMTLNYDAEMQRIIIMDMGSANGLYVNGQKIVAKEERVLRDGDQLRLGQLVLDVAYKHNPV
jgi:hypothetical protein